MLTVTNGINQAYQQNQVTGLIGDALNDIAESFGRGVGESATDQPLTLDIKFNEILVPVISGLILYFVLKSI